jgi:beta-hydroxylase
MLAPPEGNPYNRPALRRGRPEAHRGVCVLTTQLRVGERIMIFVVLGAVYVGSFSYLYLRLNDRLAFHKYLSNHVLLLAPLNFLLTFFIRGQKKAIFEAKSVPGLDKIKENYPLIRSEAKVLLDTGVFQRPPAIDEPGYNSFEKGGWRAHFLKWYTKECNSAALQMCPATCAVLDSIPAVRAAMFTVLPPGARLGRHHDPVASSLRYHLGLLTPNSEKCAMTLDGVKYTWRDGEDLLFDQTYLHSIENQTETVRVILFCDVEKTQLRGVIKSFAELLNKHVVAKFSGEHEKGKRSWISSAYMPIYRLRSYVKENVKPRSIVAYNIIKFGSIALLLFLLYLLFALTSHIV